MNDPRPGEGEALGILGLARRAGRAVVGTRAVEEAWRAGRLAALVVAGDATENARRRLSGPLRGDAVPTIEVADRVRLGAALGKGPVVAVGVTDAGLAARLLGAPEGAADRAARRSRAPRAARTFQSWEGRS